MVRGLNVQGSISRWRRSPRKELRLLVIAKPADERSSKAQTGLRNKGMLAKQLGCSLDRSKNLVGDYQGSNLQAIRVTLTQVSYQIT